MEKEIAEGNVSGMGGRKGQRRKMVLSEQMKRRTLGGKKEKCGEEAESPWHWTTEKDTLGTLEALGI